MHATTVRENRGHEFERERGGVYGRVRREEIEGEDDLITISKNKRNHFFKERQLSEKLQASPLLLRGKHHYLNHSDHLFQWMILTEQLFNISICYDCTESLWDLCTRTFLSEEEPMPLESCADKLCDRNFIPSN